MQKIMSITDQFIESVTYIHNTRSPCRDMHKKQMPSYNSNIVIQKVIMQRILLAVVKHG